MTTNGTGIAVVPLVNRTVAIFAALKFVPVTTTLVPPVIAPVLGVSDVIVGAGSTA